MPPAGPAVSVVVPVRNGARVLGGCLDALGRQTLPREQFEVVVVDNGSTDGSGRLAAEHPVRPTVVAEPRRGSYAARNAGVAAGSGPILAFTDADCRPAPEWLAAGLTAAAMADLVGGQVLPLRSDRPSRWERYDCAFYLRQADLVGEQGFAATANLFAHRRVFDRVGGFDPGLRSSGDLEWSRRATAAGFRLVYEPAAVVYHRPRTGAAGTWALHRRLGAGWGTLAGRGQRPGWLRDQAMWVPIGLMIDLVARDGPPLRRRHLAHVHAVAMAARAVGRLTRRG